MLREALFQFSQGELSRRDFVVSLGKLGIASIAANQLASSVADAVTDDDIEKIIELSGVTGGQVTCETMRSWGVEYVFGNSGAYEAPFLDALVDYPDIHYVMGLQEGSLVAMADGYSRSSGKTGVVNIHSITGTANALDLIVNAWADNSSLLITGGFSSTKGDNMGTFTETN
jgi:hypothetical protein